MVRMSRVWLSVGLLLSFWTEAATAESVDLLVVGGSEAACAAAVQAARLGVGNVALVSDIELLGGQFSAEGVGPVDERIKMDGHSVNFPRSGLALEVIRAIRAHNFKTYGREMPGNCWSGTDTIEPAAAAQIFEDLLAPQVKAGRLRIWRGCEPVRVLKEGERIVGVVFADAQGGERTFRAALTIDASDWGDVIRLGDVAHFSGVDPASRFGEKDEPTTLGPDERQEMNPITYTITLRESDRDSAIPRPAGYDARNYTSGPLKDYGILPEPYSKDCPANAYNQRRLVDRKNFGLKPDTEAIQLNTTVMDYPLVDLPSAVRAELERSEPGASAKNLAEMTPAQRRIVFADAKRRALGFLYYLQNDCPATTNLMRHMALVDDFGTPDRLPPKPYVREGLRLDALTVVTANDVRAPDEESVTWAPTRPADAAFGFQFHIDFHPTRREWIGTDRVAWRPKHSPTRSWDQYTHRAFVPLRAFVPKAAEGLLGAGKNIGMSSVVEAALRLHPQMLLSGQVSGTLAARALIEGRTPRELVNDRFAVRRIRRILAGGTVGAPGVAIYAWQDLTPDDPCFEAANVLPAMGKWELPKTFFFRPDEVVAGPDGRRMTRRELAIARLREMDQADVTGLVEAEVGRGRHFVQIPKGSYRLEPHGLSYLSFRGLRDVTVDFGGSEFVGLTKTRMLSLSACTNVTLRNLAIDYDPLTFTQAIITDVDADRNWNVKVVEGYPCPDGPEVGPDVKAKIWPVQVYDRTTLELKNPMRFQKDTALEKTGPGTYRITGGIDRRGEVGDICVWSIREHVKPNQRQTVLSHRCAGCLFEDITCYATPYGSCGFCETEAEGNVYRRCSLRRRPPETDLRKRALKRLRSGNHDAFNSRSSSRGPTLENCSFRHHCDDCVNISGYYCIVTGQKGRTLRVLSDGRVPGRVGGSAQVMTFEGNCPPDVRITAVRRLGHATSDDAAMLAGYGFCNGVEKNFVWAFEVEIDREEILPRRSVLASNDSLGNGFVIRGGDFGSCRARGFLIKASEGLIESNVVSGCFGPGVVSVPEYQWIEAGCSRDLDIRDNVFRDNLGAGVHVGGFSGAGKLLPPDAHRDIRIVGNAISGSARGILVEGCTGVVLAGNRIETPTGGASRLVITQSVDVVVRDN